MREGFKCSTSSKRSTKLFRSLDKAMAGNFLSLITTSVGLKGEYQLLHQRPKPLPKPASSRKWKYNAFQECGEQKKTNKQTQIVAESSCAQRSNFPKTENRDNDQTRKVFTHVTTEKQRKLTKTERKVVNSPGSNGFLAASDSNFQWKEHISQSSIILPQKAKAASGTKPIQYEWLEDPHLLQGRCCTVFPESDAKVNKYVKKSSVFLPDMLNRPYCYEKQCSRNSISNGNLESGCVPPPNSPVGFPVVISEFYFPPI